MQQNPYLEARDRYRLTDVESISVSAGEAPDLRACPIETLMAITIEDAENRIVATLLGCPLFSALDNADGCGAFRIVGDYDLCSSQVAVVRLK